MKKLKLTKENIALIAILILSAILNFTNLNIEKYSNEYYAAGVKSMLKSFKNFFFVSFDPSGFVTIDKPPVGFWTQAISAKIFGFNYWSILLPQAIAGVVSVWILYIIVKRYFGTMAGLISALFLAVTPIFVAASRNNTIDNQLVMVLLIASYFLFKAIDSGKLKPLILSLVFVGIGFNIKMLQAYLIIPAIYLTYFIASNIKFKKRIINLTICTVILVAVSMSWAIIVDLVPASSRPYVGSSSNNSEVELIVGHNGVERFDNSSGPGGGMGKGMPNLAEMKNMMGSGELPEGFDPSKGGMPGGISGGMPSGFGGQGGSVGITRLFSKGDLADQISWLLPLALFGFVAAAFKEKLKRPFDNGKKLSIVFWITYLVPQFIYFSFTQGLFHPYYLTMLSAPIAALVGIGMKSMWELYKENTWESYLLPAAFIVDGALELLILSYYLETSSITKVLMATVVILSFVSAIALIINKIKTKNEQKSIKELKLRTTLVSLGLVGLLITPTVWSETTLFYKMSGVFPSAGLELSKSKDSNNSGGMMGTAMGSGNAVDSSKLIKYLVANKTNEKYILVTLTASGEASSLILGSNESAMALGGFMSTDKIITLSQFKQMVKKGEVRYIMVQGMVSDMQSGDTMDQNTEIMNWSKEHGKLVEKSQWSDPSEDSKQNSTGSGSQQTQGFSMGGSTELYDLQGSVTD